MKNVKYRWVLICIALLVMMIISIYQYSWSLFAYSIKRELNWNLATVSLTFTIFAYSATFVQPFSGIVADTYGPRKIAVLASFLVGLGFVLSSFVSLPWQLYLSYGLGGLGVGVLYGVSTATAIKWFPDKRGFAVGLVVFGFGAGTAIFNWIIQALLEKEGFQNTFLFLGLAMLISLIPLSLFYKYPSNNWDTLSSENRTENAKAIIQCKPLEMLRTYQWYLMYFSFAFTASIVLMFGAQMKMLAKEFAIPENYFSILLVIFPLGNGFSRIVSGAVSDKIGREKTMMIFYGS
ncbi:MAG: MFS transporter, partial [Desulfobacteraceae bacterium]|nr:MFS transporter [Desulfobacteraceae bacterium]